MQIKPQLVNIPLFFLVIFFTLCTVTWATAQQVPDTISTEGIEFTEINPDSATQGDTSLSKADSSSKQVVAAVSGTNTETKSNSQKSLLGIFIAGLLGGFAALIMPCIFPMLPLTVSYFTKKAKSKSGAIGKATLYGVSIIVIYVVLGLLITVLFGADSLNDLSTNGIFNFIFFLIIVVFAASFLGAFELTLPSKWVNKMDEKSNAQNLSGIFFMAATLALVSFSCTGPIIGYLLVDAAVKGAILGPVVGMLGFSLALAIPFTLFAMFPSWLQSLPKSGRWLNSVKVVLGFLELALSLKFLSNVDLAYRWHWFDREIFLALWIVIFALMGLYLLGKIRFAHDSGPPYLSVPRTFLAIAVFAFVVYMVPGLWGAPLKSIAAFLPPQATQDFDLYTSSFKSGASPSGQTASRKYAGRFDKPLGLEPFFDYDEGLAYARKVNKPVMIDFTGHACVNCRKMEASVWPDKEVYKRISQDYVLIQLYVDDKTDLLPGDELVMPDGRKLTTIGKKWSYYQASRFHANSQPFYVLLDTQGNLLVEPRGADYDVKSFTAFLDQGLEAFKKKNTVL
ncbi:DUF255 domain-containing protein [Pedobacter sp. BS3]|uniref:protein-disulfide reductase DsbD family protein n=1 Tax=Pedobacter sp. BS3 TaxID=2567937 RepID=UPI0011EBF5A6|nr:cytochrome c biogenesis protein CcdA [Pedobacter sp. BS3]TZF83617.1 DUF255 domain-containing protein [Pedobacter sp. BS3]